LIEADSSNETAVAVSQSAKISGKFVCRSMLQDHNFFEPCNFLIFYSLLTNNAAAAAATEINY